MDDTEKSRAREAAGDIAERDGPAPEMPLPRERPTLSGVEEFDHFEYRELVGL